MCKKILLFSLLVLALQGYAQTLPVGLLQNLEDNLRRQQLLGTDTSKSSFMVRPLTMYEQNNVLLDQDHQVSLHSFRKRITAENSKLSLYLLPVSWQHQFNSHHPYGWNDGAMVPAKGYQTFISTGIYAKFGPLSVQLRPEYVFAENKKFTQLYEAGNENSFMVNYIHYANKIDNPERMGDGTYSKFNWGQSSIRINVDPVSIGISNENLWWGPGIRNSLLMSNNAPGFKHLTLNTTRPVHTPIGSFETQLIGGKLEASNIKVNDPRFTEKPKDWRYLSGIVFSYQPKWVPNLFLGFDRSFIVYRKDMGNSFSDYFPLFSGLNKATASGGGDAEDRRRRDQYISAFARWVMPEAKSEIYIQYGKNDHNYNLRDLMQEPEHTRAYVVGFRKLVPLRKADQFIQAGIELTQMEGSKSILGRAYESWYAHYQVRDGYTQLGQVLGAGIGTGGNLQSFNLSWVKGLKRIGLQFERMVNNADVYYTSIIYDSRRKWIDLSASGQFDWTFNNFIVNAQLTYIRSHNYQYRIEGVSPIPEKFWEWDQQDVTNLHAKVGLMYRW